MSKYDEYNLKPGHFWADVRDQYGQILRRIGIDEVKDGGVIVVNACDEGNYYENNHYLTVQFKNHTRRVTIDLKPEDLAGCWLKHADGIKEMVIATTEGTVKTEGLVISISSLKMKGTTWGTSAKGEFSSDYTRYE